MNRILLREQFLKDRKKLEQSQRIDEVFSSEIPWGDSLIGRMINSIARKANISWGKRKIGDKDSGLIGELNAQFEILRDSVQLGLSGDDYKFIESLTLFEQFSSLIDKDDVDIDELLEAINAMISQFGSYDLQNSEEIISNLEKFMKWLKDLKGERDDKEKESGEESDEGDGESGEGSGVKEETVEKDDREEKVENPDVTKKDGDKSRVLYPLMVSNLNSLLYLIKNIDNITIDEEEEEDKNKDTVDRSKDLRKDKKIDKDQLNNPDINPKNINIKVIESYTNGSYLPINEFKNSDDRDNQRGVMKTGDRKFGSDKSKSNIVSKGSKGQKLDAHTSQSIVNLRRYVKTLSTDNKKGIIVNVELLTDILNHHKEKVGISLIKKTYSLVYDYLYGSRKSSLNPDTRPLFESFVEEYRNDPKGGKLEPIAEKIARFTHRALRFNDNENPLSLANTEEGLYGPLGDYGKELKKYNSTMGKILSVFKEDPDAAGIGAFKSEGDKVRRASIDKNEHLIRTYMDFMKMNEAIEVKDGSEYKEDPESSIGEPTSEKPVGNQGSIKIEFEKLFKPKISEMFVLDREVKIRLKKLEKSGRLVLRSPDPIMEIVMIFHRAWRIHTPGVIPSGRKDGKVSNSVFREYEYMGTGQSGTPTSPQAGPYRNIKLWDIWLKGVNDILADTEFRNTIFSDECEFVFSDKREKPESIKGSGKNKSNIGEELVKEDVEVSEKPKESKETGESTKRPLGKILLSFINRLMSNSEMYRQGALTKFMDEYFGLDGSSLDIKFSEKDKKDIRINSEVAGKIETVTTVKFKKYDDVRKLFQEKSSIFEYLVALKNDGKAPTGICFRIKNKSDKKYNFFILKKVSKDNGGGGRMVFFCSEGASFDNTSVKMLNTAGDSITTGSSISPVNVALHLGSGKFIFNNSDDKNTTNNVECDLESLEVLVSSDEKSIYTKMVMGNNIDGNRLDTLVDILINKAK